LGEIPQTRQRELAVDATLDFGLIIYSIEAHNTLKEDV